MSGFGLSPSLPKPGAAPAHRWSWFVALGIIQIIVGVLCWIDVAAASIAGVVILGVLLLIGGVFQIVHAFTVRGWSGFLLYVLIGILYVLGGFLLMDEPVRGSLIITIVIAVMLIVSGIARLIVAATHRHMQGLWLVILSGIVSFAVGIMLYASLPWSSLWVLGTLIAIELVFHGIAWVQFGFALKRSHTA
ncbi:HdeD family acid-resistance protein [Acidisoma cellulosilytica]|uniref:HdeD family acid-resistance protein n=1 Tax=Acidisoma cellulosilyticum TaxID=2802395 RepID=A0A963YYJ5_9PROT|nr:HdeD family acid-resistance protein [Acidisoma cellulosilyticum]MCB8879206.1 HdeD family acid-resistance protein [Acidisoma cellulosilyticum]